MYITLTNNFHNTTVRLRLKPVRHLSPSQIRRAGHALCGMPGCLCSGPLGIRGPQIQPDGHRIDLSEEYDRNGVLYYRVVDYYMGEE